MLGAIRQGRKVMEYMDRTFCPFYQECWHGEDCSAALTPQIRLEADKWWHEFMHDGSEPHIFMFTSRPECFKEVTK
jgi:hypothetical protein